MDISLITVKRILEERKQEIMRERARKDINLSAYQTLTQAGARATEMYEIETAIKCIHELDRCFHIRNYSSEYNQQIAKCGFVLSNLDLAIKKPNPNVNTDIINTHLYLALENLNLALEYIS